MVTSIRRRIPHLIAASGLAATLALGAGAATATAAHQEVPKAKAAPTAPCSEQNPCTGGNQNNQSSGNRGGNQNNQSSGNRGGNQNNQSSGNTGGKLPRDCGRAYCPDFMPPTDTTNAPPRNVPYDPDPGYNDTRGKLPPGNVPYDPDPGYNDTRGKLPRDCGRAYCPDFMPPTDTTNGAPRNAP
ncbi:MULTISPECIES: hypothetical protein [unclassified Streptomyces]|uniref:hypothetical protein n=1 Tax=unclassified Streptomyces TaxID=2593676 RepID=UPI00131EAD6F|nr:hypothetical protein [Streptomyces sp. CB01635]